MTRNELKNLWFSIPKQVNKKEIKLPVNDNSTKLVSDYDWKEFDEWMESLIAKNGTTDY